MKGTATVIGGGIGGLAAAIGLLRTGWDVTVLERAASFGEIGAGMSQSPNALRALDALGVGEQARAVGTPFQATDNIRLHDGRRLVRPQPGRTPPLLGFHRADLHRVLLDAVPAARLRTGVEATVERGADGGFTVTGHDADLVVAADGVHSRTRAAVWPEAPRPKFWGNTVWRGVAEISGVEGSMTLGPGHYFLLMPLARGRVYWALAGRAEREGIRYPDELAEARRRVAGWPDDIQTVLDATPPAAVLHHDMADLEGMPSFAQGNVVLLGDAAHAMHPDMAQGAAQSLEDAVVLAAALADADDIDTGLAAYDLARRRRTQTIVRQARGKALMATTPRRLGYLLQTLAPRIVPSSRWPALAERALAPVWGWEPPVLPLSR